MTLAEQLLENEVPVWQQDPEQEFPTVFALMGTERRVIDMDDNGTLVCSIYPNVEDWYDQRPRKSKRAKTDHERFTDAWQELAPACTPRQKEAAQRVFHVIWDSAYPDPFMRPPIPR